ncbi:MAG: hypothetical protein QOG63_877 [Thermoleophilaceae bacterium]|jgi:hypothetical protein|nr:hypothetical protein [Thermoleophilaceae bacterium]
MRARGLISVAVVVAVAVSAATTALQLALRSSARAASGGGSSAQQLNQQLNHDFQAQLSVRAQVLAQLKATRKKTEASFAALQAHSTDADGHAAASDTNTAGALVPMSSSAADYKLLTEEAPPGFDLAPQLDGLIPRMLSVAHSFCIDAETTGWGHVSRERPLPQHCDERP